MGGLEVHEHQPFTVFSEGSHPVGVHADPVHTINVVEGDKDWITVEGVDARYPMIITLCDMPFLKIRQHQQARSWLKKLRPEGFE